MGDIFDAMSRAEARRPDSRPDPSTLPTPVPAHADDAVPPGPFTAVNPGPTARPRAAVEHDEHQGPVAAIGPDAELDLDRVDDRLVALLDPSSIMAEEYRSVRTGLLARWQNRRHVLTTITSATPQEGKTITSLNLGLSFAELRNRSTLVIEADLRLPQFATMLGLEDKHGLIDVLEGKSAFDDVVRTIGPNRLSIVSAGGRAHDKAVQLLAGNGMVALLRQLRQRFDHVIIDTPPVVELADAGIVGALCDDVLVIVRMNRTPRTLVDQAVRTLTSYNAPVAGIVATDQAHRAGRYYSKYGYKYRYRYYHKRDKAA